MTTSVFPYNLRINKAIERSIFIDLLIRVNKFKLIDEYTYIGFGSTHLEDFKMIHTTLGINKLISIEKDQKVYKRQLFNKPINCIELINCSSGEFIQEYEFDNNCIVWLDYESPKQLNEQIREFQSLIEKCGYYDIVKITVNANPEALGTNNGSESKEELYKRRLEKLRSRISLFLNESVTHNDMTMNGLPKVIADALINAANQITRRDSKKYFPISSFVYIDFGHQMLTLTGILLDKQSNFLDQIQISNWKYSYVPEQQIHRINLPDLTLKERLMINSMLPCDDYSAILKGLGYEDIPDFSSEIESYVNYYRHFPSFSRVII